ncbi:type II toxin-antitoxin system Phd/YefM family antitoxin [Micromonospora sp. NPDC048986]|uniref:type II toxin-antitoxin system Phd/YefM family antitoxin n=1 Tax=Micromonospora sp. NPDC048986 TaxID=3155644 RepID=UPI0033F8CFAC
MTSKNVGIEEARKRLGELVTAAQQGTDVILTRNGKPAARIVAFKEHTVVSSMESASTPIASGGYTYDHEVDGPDFVDFTAAELRTLASERGYDFSSHPEIVIAAAEKAVTAAQDRATAARQARIAFRNGPAAAAEKAMNDAEVHSAEYDAAAAAHEALEPQWLALDKDVEAAEHALAAARIAWESAMGARLDV